MHGLSLPAPIGAAGRVQLPIAARCGFCSTNLPSVRQGATHDSSRRRNDFAARGFGFDGGVESCYFTLLEYSYACVDSRSRGRSGSGWTVSRAFRADTRTRDGRAGYSAAMSALFGGAARL